MAPAAIVLRLTHTGATNQTVYLSDIYNADDQSLKKTGPPYVHVGGYSDFVYSTRVAASYANGAIRGFLTKGWLTAQFILDATFIAAIPLPGSLKNGRVTFTDANFTMPVVFAVPFADVNYSVVGMAVEVTVGMANVNVWADTLTPAGCNLNISLPPGFGNSLVVHWIAVHD